ncbi:MAG: hypothetical protein O3A63_07280 [Proteobacteria bacterium]|nr:hypothetical protein [Pseudomonadota bacterium]
MLIESLEISKTQFEAGTGFQLKPDRACKGAVCIPLDGAPGARIDVRKVAARLGMALVHDEPHKRWALGPETIGNRALTTAVAADLRLPDVNGNEFRLSDLRGQKVLLYAWAPY